MAAGCSPPPARQTHPEEGDGVGPAEQNQPGVHAGLEFFCLWSDMWSEHNPQKLTSLKAQKAKESTLKPVVSGCFWCITAWFYRQEIKRSTTMSELTPRRVKQKYTNIEANGRRCSFGRSRIGSILRRPRRSHCKARRDQQRHRRHSRQHFFILFSASFILHSGGRSSCYAWGTTVLPVRLGNSGA